MVSNTYKLMNVCNSLFPFYSIGACLKISCSKDSSFLSNLSVSESYDNIKMGPGGGSHSYGACLRSEECFGGFLCLQQGDPHSIATKITKSDNN